MDYKNMMIRRTTGDWSIFFSNSEPFQRPLVGSSQFRFPSHPTDQTPGTNHDGHHITCYRKKKKKKKKNPASTIYLNLTQRMVPNPQIVHALCSAPKWPLP